MPHRKQPPADVPVPRPDMDPGTLFDAAPFQVAPPPTDQEQWVQAARIEAAEEEEYGDSFQYLVTGLTGLQARSFRRKVERFASKNPLGQQIVEHQSSLTALHDWLDDNDPNFQREFDPETFQRTDGGGSKDLKIETAAWQRFSEDNGLNIEKSIASQSINTSHRKRLAAANRLQGMLESLAVNPRYAQGSQVTVARTPKDGETEPRLEDDWRIDSVVASGRFKVVKDLPDGTTIRKFVKLSQLDELNGHAPAA